MLTTEEKQFIRANHNTMRILDMAKALSTTYQVVIYFMKKNSLNYVKETTIENEFTYSPIPPIGQVKTIIIQEPPKPKPVVDSYSLNLTINVEEAIRTSISANQLIVSSLNSTPKFKHHSTWFIFAGHLYLSGASAQEMTDVNTSRVPARSIKRGEKYAVAFTSDGSFVLANLHEVKDPSTIALVRTKLHIT